MNPSDESKRIAVRLNTLLPLLASEAVNTCIKSGMRVGLGTGSTASFAVERLAERIRQGELTDISCASTSEATRKLAESLGINVLSLDEISLPLDVTIDGADEVLKNGSQMVLIKGRGGALLREKIVEVNSKAFICVADEGKVVQPDSFGTTGAVALEVVQFGAQATRQAVLSAVVSTLGGEVLEAEEETPEEAAERLGVSAVFRHHENRKELFVSDNGNLCLDLFFKRPIPDPQKMHDRLINVVGVVETGIFIGISKLCIIGHSSGTTTRLAV